jgi:fatty acid desaturase
MLSKFYVGELAPSQLVKPSAWQLEMQELIRNFVKQGLFESSKLFYFAKIVQSMLICLLGVAIIFYYPNRLDSVVLSSFFFGLGWQQLGWLTHDFLHHQVFSNRTLNNAMGYFLGDFLQGFSVGWSFLLIQVEAKALHSSCCSQCSYSGSRY